MEECEPELVFALPWVELDRGGVLGSAGGTTKLIAEPRHRWNQCERHPAVRRRSLEPSGPALHRDLQAVSMVDSGKAAVAAIVDGEVSWVQPFH